MEFTRETDSRDITTVLPVGERSVALSLEVGRGTRAKHPFCALREVDGEAVKGNETGRPCVLVNGQRYALQITVALQGDQAHIDAELDGDSILAWQGPQTALSVKSHWQAKYAVALGIGTYESSARFLSVRIKVLDGELKYLREPPPGFRTSAAPPPTVAPHDAGEGKPDEQAGVEQDPADGVRTWTDTSGNTVEAAFVKLEDGVVHLRRPDGKIAPVPLEKLSKQDQEFVSEQAGQSVAP